MDMQNNVAKANTKAGTKMGPGSDRVKYIIKIKAIDENETVISLEDTAVHDQNVTASVIAASFLIKQRKTVSAMFKNLNIVSMTQTVTLEVKNLWDVKNYVIYDSRLHSEFTL
jgi:hypothetical protein